MKEGGVKNVTEGKDLTKSFQHVSKKQPEGV